MMHRPITFPRADAGFTLIELLVSLSLLVIMVALINSSLQFGRRAWEVSDQIERTYSIAAFRNLLGQRLVETLPLVNWDERGVSTSTFQGGSDYLRFVSALSTREGLPAGLFTVTLKHAAQGSVAAWPLSLELKPLGDGDVPTGLRSHTPVFIENVARLVIRYYGTPERGGDPRWFDDWQGQSTLPSLVSVDLQFPSGDSRRWPPFTAELKLVSKVRPQR
jgi:general secretion pathway protein J